MTIRRIAFCAVLIALLVSPVRGQEEVAIMTVTNGGSVVNGNTTSFEALTAAPGSDGISFAEAVEASNGTAGPKLIKFAPELVRNPIEVVPEGADRRLFILTSGRLTIDGDVDGDGKPDITLVAPITASSAAIVVRSSRNTIRGLNFVTFPDAAIVFTCLDAACEERGIIDTRIENNTFFSPRGAGINVAPTGIRPVDVPYVTDVIFDGLTITGNEFTVRDTAISFIPGYGGLQHVTGRGIAITNNKISAAVGIEVVAGGRSAQPYFSDFNSIENLTIERNTFVDCTTGITIAAGDWSGSDNALRHVRIAENDFVTTKTGVRIAAALDGIPQRSGDRNVIDDVTIVSNRMSVQETGIMISAGGAPAADSSAVGYRSNTVTNVTIDRNTIKDFTGTAIHIWAGLASSPATVNDNSVQGLSITNNDFQALELAHAPVAVSITSGQASAGGAQRNSVRDVSIIGNRSTGPGIFLQLIGGSGTAARSNTLDFPRMGSNTWQSAVPLTTAQNVNGASGNTISGILRRRAVRL